MNCLRTASVWFLSAIVISDLAMGEDVKSIYLEAEPRCHSSKTVPIQNPTLKWIFQMMEGVSIVTFFESHIVEPVREVITGLNQLRIKIVKLFGPSAQKIYGVT